MDKKLFKNLEIIVVENGYVLKVSALVEEFTYDLNGTFIYKTMEEVCEKLKELDSK